MPELPEVESYRQQLVGLVGSIINSVTLHRANLRTPFPVNFASRLQGQTLTDIDRKGKYLLFRLSSGDTWLTHLGMTGWFHIGHLPNPKHDHVSVSLTHPTLGNVDLVYTDSRRFGFMDIFQGDDSPSLLGLGPEPDHVTAESLKTKLVRKKAPIKPALLDQRVVSGLGNIYASEVLFDAKISPLRSANSLTDTEYKRLAKSIKRVIDIALIKGEPYLYTHAAVYGRDGDVCKGNCVGTVHKIVQMGRSTYYCSVCQV